MFWREILNRIFNVKAFFPTKQEQSVLLSRADELTSETVGYGDEAHHTT